MKTVNFENAIVVTMNAIGNIEEGLIGYQECSGHAELDVLDVDTDEKLGSINIDIESHGMKITGYDGQMIFTIINTDGEETSRVTFNSMTGREGYDQFVAKIGSITRRSKAGVKEMLANAGEAVGRNTKVHKETWNWNVGAKH